jgi:hypothetical protein
MHFTVRPQYNSQSDHNTTHGLTIIVIMATFKSNFSTIEGVGGLTGLSGDQTVSYIEASGQGGHP